MSSGRASPTPSAASERCAWRRQEPDVERLTPAELSLVTAAAPARPVATISPERYRDLAARAKLLSWLSLGVMSVEGIVATAALVALGRADDVERLVARA